MASPRTRQRATATAKALLSGSAGDQWLGSGVGQAAMDQAARGQAAVAQIAALADEIVATSKANRELLIGLVRAEVDRAVTGLGLVTRDDFEALRRTVDRLSVAQTKVTASARPTAAKRAAGNAGKKAAKKGTKKTASKPATHAEPK